MVLTLNINIVMMDEDDRSIHVNDNPIEIKFVFN